MRKMTFAAATLLALGLTGCSSEPDFMEVGSLTKPDAFGMGTYLNYVTIRSLTEELEIQDLTVNRGNCRVLKYSGRSQLPKTISYGETTKVQVNNDCDILEVDIETDQGAGTYSFGS
ncbi:hypothetical protein [Alcanivorax sp.]|mgnify:CR=1 FL=1|uniref:hypothetical protein n=1 Tax=Alcanivorax sp. TaxID=1872427 RepID=UPI0026122CC3|nr:hypothetical protein [Alcanivorax sp.]